MIFIINNNSIAWKVKDVIDEKQGIILASSDRKKDDYDRQIRNNCITDCIRIFFKKSKASKRR
ncbi:hypothetical protein SCA04_13620 [Staphylococcus carnosus]|nr:hypothetical protein SCA04_13620 [Staphylococcus carnosus]